MNRQNLLAVLLLAGITGTGGAAHSAQLRSEPLATSPPRAVQSRTKEIRTAQLDARLAHEWHLTPQEWVRYQHLMRGPLGIWSPHLDPLTALGIEARSNAERAHYAALEVRMEGERVAKILSFQRAYTAAWKRLYPHLEPVDFAHSAGADHDPKGSGSGRLAVFVKEPCQPCVDTVRALQAHGRAFDIYMVGLETDPQIRAWATRVGIDPAKVRAGIITLNHDAGRWLKVGDQDPLPAVLAKVNGRWQRE